MDKKNAKQRILKLCSLIETHNEYYYVQNQPTITDAEYDALVRELITLESQYPDLKLADSPTQRIGAKVDGVLPTITHQVKMMSLDNTYSIDELRLWDGRVRKGLGEQSYAFHVEMKIDGASCALTYENGILVLGATRGMGSLGKM